MTENRAAELWADIADLVLNVAREIQTRGYRNPEVIRVTPTEGNVLRFIDHNPGSTAGEVAYATGLHRSNLSPTLRALEEMGLIRRDATGADGRVTRLFPTPLAERNLVLIRAEWGSVLGEAEHVGEAALEQVFETLRAAENALVRGRQRDS